MPVQGAAVSCPRGWCPAPPTGALGWTSVPAVSSLVARGKGVMNITPVLGAGVQTFPHNGRPRWETPSFGKLTGTVSPPRTPDAPQPLTGAPVSPPRPAHFASLQVTAPFPEPEFGFPRLGDGAETVCRQPSSITARGCGHLLAAVNRVSNTLRVPASDSSGETPSSGIAGSRGSSISKRLRNLHSASHRGCAIHIPTNSAQGSALHVLANASFPLFPLTAAMLAGVRGLLLWFWCARPC